MMTKILFQKILLTPLIDVWGKLVDPKAVQAVFEILEFPLQVVCSQILCMHGANLQLELKFSAQVSFCHRGLRW